MTVQLDKRAYFEAVASEWDAMQPDERGRGLLALLRAHAYLFQRAERVLDVGTGTGALIAPIRELAPWAWLLSIDFAFAMLEGVHAKHPCANLVQADVNNLPLAVGNDLETFDLVVCHNVYPHFDHPLVALRALAGVVRTGGHLLILHDQPREAVNALHCHIGGVIGHDHLPEAKDLVALLHEAGYGSVEVEEGASHFSAVARVRG